MTKIELINLISELKGEKFPTKKTISLVEREIEKARDRMFGQSVPTFYKKSRMEYINEVARRNLIEIVMA